MLYNTQVITSSLTDIYEDINIPIIELIGIKIFTMPL